MAKSKRYQLTSATGDGPKMCAFFFSDKGCRNGANCKFSHVRPSELPVACIAAPKPSGPPSVSSSSSSSVVSSEESDDDESDGEIVENRAGTYAPLAPPAVANPFLTAVGVPTSPAPAHAVVNNAAKKEEPLAEKKKKKRKEKSETTSSPVKSETNGTVAAPPKPAAAVAAPPSKKAKRAEVEKQHPTDNNHLPPSFRNMQLPITAFSCMPSADAADPKTPSAERPSQPQNDHASSPPSLPLPTATPAHLKWKDACVATRQHSNYSDAFDYGKAQQMEIANGISTPSDWITTRPYGEWCKSNPAAIAIDCEMCATKDPVSGKVNPKALCRISVVNAEKPEEVLLDTLVKPEWPVVSYRTWVNGISESELKDVQFTMKHAQQFMAALCSDQTLVVGHAVHNDLLTLRMIHHCNVDTAMLFSHGGENSGTVSLKNLALAVMKRDMPEVHDSVNDARVALRCAEHYVANDGKVDPVKKVHNRNSSSGIETDGSDTSVLFVHRLPNGILQEHITEMFLAYTYIKPKKVNAIEFSGTHGKVHVEFFTKEHAELAYMSLEGVAKADKVGRKQKRVGLKGGGYVYIRKMRKGK